MSAILKRAHHVLLVTVALVFGLTLLAPLATLASSDLVAGQQAIVDNPNGTGANLRSDVTVLDDSTLITEIAQGATVTITGGPVIVDNGAWFWVSTADGTEGLVSSTLLRSAPEEVPAETVTEPVDVETTEPTSPDLLWQEPIDTGFVVDNNNDIPVEGLACRATATVDGEIITRMPVNAPLQVVSPRIHEGELSFVHINCADGAGYVNGDYVVLESEQAPVPTEPVAETPIVEEPVIEDPAVEAPVTEEPVVEDPATEEPVLDAPVTEDVAVETPVTEEAVVDDPAADDATEEPVVDAVVTEEPVVDEPVVDEPAATDPVDGETNEVPLVTDEPVVEAATPAPELPIATEDATDVPAEEPVVTEEPVAEGATPAPAPTEEPAVTEEATEVPTEAATEATPSEEAVPTEAPKVVEPTVPAVTAPASDINAMIGSATVTGTNGEGLRCRVAPKGDAATLMLLDEGTKVYVLSEATNGYLGIDCGGLQGFADVNFLWSGGAGDGEIQKSNMSLVVSGTGNGLNCRTGASTSYPVITVLRDGTKLSTRAAASNGWVAVVCGGQNGFVATPYVSVSGGGSGSTAPSTGSGSGTATVSNTNGDGLYCRTGAGSSYSVITVLSPGQSVAVRGANQGAWTPVTCGGKAGFAHSDYLSIKSGGSTAPAPSNPAPGASTGTVTVANTGGVGLNCRSGASTSHGVITVLRLGQSVSTRSGSTSGWQAVVCGGQNGFVSSEFVTGGGSAPAPEKPKDPAPAPKPSGLQNGDHGATTASLNLRYDASLGAGVAAVAPEGTVILITGGASNGFFPVDWDGLKGFMSGDYLVKTSAALSQRGGSAQPEPSAPPTSGGGTATGNAMVDYAMAYLGYPYVWATHGPASFDCSGFTYWVAKNVMGVNIGYGTWTQVSAGTRVSRDNLQPGDLVFFQNTYTAGLSHVGLYIGNGKFIHAENENTGVRISDLDSTYYGSRWYGAVRL